MYIPTAEPAEAPTPHRYTVCPGPSRGRDKESLPGSKAASTTFRIALFVSRILQVSFLVRTCHRDPDGEMSLELGIGEA